MSDYTDIYIGANSSGDLEQSGNFSGSQDCALIRENFSNYTFVNSDTVKYRKESWIKQFNTDCSVTVNDIKADSSGNIYMCGVVGSSSDSCHDKHFNGIVCKGEQNGFLVKFDYNKNIVWTFVEKMISGKVIYQYNYQSSGENTYNALDIDATGNVYVAGLTNYKLWKYVADDALTDFDKFSSFADTTSGYVPFIRKFNTNGAIQTDTVYIPFYSNKPSTPLFSIKKLIVSNSHFYLIGQLGDGIPGYLYNVTNFHTWVNGFTIQGTVAVNQDTQVGYISKIKIEETSHTVDYIGNVISTETKWGGSMTSGSTDDNLFLVYGSPTNSLNDSGHTRDTFINDAVLDDSGNNLYIVGKTLANLETALIDQSANNDIEIGFITKIDTTLSSQAWNISNSTTSASYNHIDTTTFTDSTGDMNLAMRNAKSFGFNNNDARVTFNGIDYDIVNDKLYVVGTSNCQVDFSGLVVGADSTHKHVYLANHSIDSTFSQDANSRKVFEGTVNDTNTGESIGLDALNNIYISGQFSGDLGGLTKTDPDSGITTWENRYVFRFNNQEGSEWTADNPDTTRQIVAQSSGETFTRLSLSEFIPCLLEGTLILTDQGNLPIEEVTINNTIRGMNIKKVSKNKVPSNKICRIPQGWFDLNKPERDTFITKSHNICIENEKKFPKNFIRAGNFDCADLPNNLENRLYDVYHISFGNKHSYYFANNLPVESLNPKFNKF